jgi:threonine dehydratase
MLEVARRLEGVARHTPLLPSDRLSAAVGRPVYLKLENLQVTGSFKVRGAVAALSAPGATQRARGVITASASTCPRPGAW